MSRRRLNMVYSSSDDEEPPQSPNHHLPPPPPSEQQDEVFIDVEEQIEDADADEQMETLYDDPIPNLESVTLDSSLASNAAAVAEAPDEEFVDVAENLSPSPPEQVSSGFVVSDCPVNDCLRKLGLCLRRDWLESCKLGLQNTVSGFSGFDVETKAKLCFEQALFSDLNYTGAGVLPPNVHQMHLVDLPGPFVLQVDEMVNICCPIKERYKSATPGLKRCLKLSMTDGMQRVFGMEYRPIPSKTLQDLAPAGFKVVIRNVNVRHGLLMLVPEVLEVLGGSVEELEAARGRLVHEINKPPRGKRSRTGIVPPLSVRATLAAWPQNGVNNNTLPVNGSHHSPVNSANPSFHATGQFSRNVQGADIVHRNMQAPVNMREATEVSTAVTTDQRSISGESAQCSVGGEAAQHSTTIETDALPAHREVTEPSSRRESTGLSSFSINVTENEDTHMVDHLEHPFILSGGKELPFTYLASLSAQWAAVQGNKPFVQGKIKCIMTGVKSFQYQHQSTFDLHVYVDDGSLISEILIHHNVVQEKIGYSPQEVTLALAASDKNIVQDMKGTLKQFQFFLVNFEGIMLVEMNETSTVPVALEMSQGSTTSDAWLLLQRLRPVTSSQPCQNDQSDVICLSP